VLMNKLFPRSIKRQLFVMVFIMAFFAAGIIVYSGVSSRNEKIGEALKDSAMLADSLFNEHEKMVSDVRQLMLMLAQLYEIKKYDAAGMQQILVKVIRENPKYSNIFIVNRTGRVMASAVPVKDTNVSDRRYFINALASGRFSSGEYTISRFTGKSVLPFAYPFKDKSGEILGVIVMGIDLTHYRTLLDTLQLPSGSSYLLLDHKGTIMTRGINPADFVGEQYNLAAFKRMGDGPDKDAFVAVAHDGIKRFISYRKIRLEGEQTPYMYIRSGIPVATALSVANKTLMRNLVLFTASLCFVVVFILLIAKYSIINRIALLEIASKRMADGDLNVKISDLVAGGELGRLGLTFDHMARQIALRKEALEQKTLEQNAILENALVGIAFLKDRRFVWINSKLEQMFGYRMSEVTGLTTELFYPSRESYKQLGSEAYPVLAASGTYYSERLMKRKDGSLFWCSISGKNIDPSELSKGAIWVLHDITERKRSEEALLISEERLRQSVRVSNLGIFDHDHLSETIYWSAHQREIYGWGPDETVTLRAFIECIHPEDRERITADVRRAHDPAGDGLYGVEHRIIRRDGSVRWVITRSQTFFSGESGARRPVRTIGAVSDITERKKAEERIGQSLREKETLLRELYHRTKNNMQVITSLLNLQSFATDDEKALQIIEDTKNRIFSMALVHEKLYKAKDLSRVNLRDYIPDLTTSLMESYQICGGTISLLLDIDDIAVSIDTITPCGLVINELMTNTLKYAFPDNRAGKITISAHSNAEGIIELRFSDDGIGLPEGVELNKPESLGLKIVHILVETQLKGKIAIERKHGTGFVIRFKEIDKRTTT